MKPLFSLFVCFFLLRALAEAKGWEVWEDCRLDKQSYYEGDSFTVVYRGGKAIIKLYYVDTPEVDTSYPKRVKAQGIYFGGLAKTDVLELGQQARIFTGKVLSKPFAIITRLDGAPGRSDVSKYYGLVKTSSGRYLSELLVRRGLARIQGREIRGELPRAFSPSSYVRDLYKVEMRARKRKLGGWADSF